MKKPPVQVQKQGKWVWQNTTTESIRVEEDLCTNCGNKQGCLIFKSLATLATEKTLGFIVTFCPAWKKPPS